MSDERMEQLKKEVIQYAGLVEHMIGKSINGLLKKDAALLHEVLEQDEPRVNAAEIAVDAECTALIAQLAPKAGDLRLVLMALKMGNDLERMGDHAVNIAESALFLIERPMIKPLLDIPRTADVVIEMLRDSIRAFIDQDTDLARRVCERDKVVDDLRNQILRELITYMSADPTTIERSIHLLRITSNLERIADLSTNVCEDIIFITEGRVIKHHSEDNKTQ